MGKIQNVRRLLPCRIAVATGVGLLAVVAGVGMAPAGADHNADQHNKMEVVFTSPNVRAGIEVEGDALSVEAGGSVGVEGTLEASLGSGDLTVHEVVGVVAKAEQVVFAGHSGGSH